MKFYSCLPLLCLAISCASPRYALDTTKTSFNDLLDNIIKDQGKIRSLQANSRISVDSEDYSGNFYASVFYKDNDSLLVSVNGPFGITAGTLFIAKNRFIFYNQLSNKFLTGAVEDYGKRNFFQFPLNLNELSYILTAREALTSMKILEFSIRDNQFFVDAENGSLSHQIWIDPFSGQISKIVTAQAGNTMYTKEYSDFIRVDDLVFPQKISLVRYKPKQAISVFYSNVRLNNPIDPQYFTVSISDGAQQIDPAFLDQYQTD